MPGPAGIGSGPWYQTIDKERAKRRIWEELSGLRIGGAGSLTAVRRRRRALTDVSFGVNEGELFSIIGPNGAGKTSIVNCVSGRYTPRRKDSFFYQGRDITGLEAECAGRARHSARTFQNLALFHHMTVLDNIMVEASITS